MRQRRCGRRRRTPTAVIATLGAASLALLQPPLVAQEATMHHAGASTTVRSEDPASVDLPAAVGAWHRVGEVRHVDPSAIFDYMDGAGELYLAYRLDRLDVVEYRAPHGGDITVELYWVASSDDAFGLLSGDWGGEAVALGGGGAAGEGRGRPRALIGAGLLRLWSGDLYARVLASQDDAAARDAVLSLGRTIVAGRREAPTPPLVDALPAVVGDFAQRRDSVCLLRSHLVLNSSYFLSQHNILDLGPNVTAVTARYDSTPAAGAATRVQLLTVAYRDDRSASKAVERFHRAYLPEVKREAAAAGSAGEVEDGWVAYRVAGRCVALAFGCPGRAAAAAFAEAGLAALRHVEVCHE